LLRLTFLRSVWILNCREESQTLRWSSTSRHLTTLLRAASFSLAAAKPKSFISLRELWGNRIVRKLGGRKGWEIIRCYRHLLKKSSTWCTNRHGRRSIQYLETIGSRILVSASKLRNVGGTCTLRILDVLIPMATSVRTRKLSVAQLVRNSRFQDSALQPSITVRIQAAIYPSSSTRFI